MRSIHPCCSFALAALFVVVVGCETDSRFARGDAGAHDAGARDAAIDASAHDDAGGDDADGGEPAYGGLVVDTDRSAHVLDLFGAMGHRIWVEVSDEQLAAMNALRGGGWIDLVKAAIERKQLDAFAQARLLLALEQEQVAAANVGLPGGDIYTPGGIGAEPTYADHVVVSAADGGGTADYGKLEVRLVGESTFRRWDASHIPNLRFDTDEFEVGKRVGGFEHFRLNNGLVGTIFREAIAQRIFRELGYLGVRATYAKLGSNVWGSNTWVPMTLIEVYKRKFCQDNRATLGGDCVNMWELSGDPAAADFAIPPNACQIGACTDTKLAALSEEVAKAPHGAGFEAALAPLVDWPRFRQFQCLSWILSTGDDAIHAGNNNLIIERDDGKLVWAPYSVDISAGSDWAAYTPLLGWTGLAQGCQHEPGCWNKTLTTCEALIEKFDALDPEKLVDRVAADLKRLGMLRDGDDERARQLRDWYLERQSILPAELERYRILPDASGVCPGGLELCADQACGTAEQCLARRCNPYELWCEPAQGCYMPQFAECVDDGDGGVGGLLPL